jgi:ABC-type Zn uptake system ZnuABC Zn-binding protein ZnuA
MYSLLSMLTIFLLVFALSACGGVPSAEEGDAHDHDHGHSGVDPHTWMSPINVMVWTDNIAAVLAALDPANADVYAANAASYTGELEDLDTWIAEQIAQIPQENRELAALQEDITEFDVPAIFVGNTVNPDLAEQVAADTGVQLLPIYTGSLSEEGGPVTSYIELMRYNTQQFVTGLSE